MKIVHLCSEYPPQDVFGLGRFVHDLAVAQAASGHDVHVVTNSMGGASRDLLQQGVNVHRVDFPPPPKPVDSGSMVTQFNTQVIERVFRDHIGNGASVINAHDWLTALAGKLVAGLLQIPFVLTVHDLIIGKRFKELSNDDKFVGNIEHWACHEADQVISVSKAITEELAQAYGASSNVSTIHNAVDPANFPEPDPVQLGYFRQTFAENDEPLALYVGRLDQEKGVDVLLHAFALLRERNVSAKLVIAGTGAGEATLKQLAHNLGIADLVSFVGYAGAQVLPYLYHAAQLHVVPSLYEPFGIVALESMACGLPVLASNTGGLAEIVRSGTTGILAKPADPSAFAAGMQKLLTSPELASKMGAAGKHRVLEQYSWKQVAIAVDASYRSAIQGDAAKRQEPEPPVCTTANRPTVLFDCTAIQKEMTGIGQYADQLLQAIPSVWPECNLLLLTTPMNRSEIATRFDHRCLCGNEEFRLVFPDRQKAIGRMMQKAGADVYFGPMFDAPEAEGAASVSMIHDLAFLKFPNALPPALTRYTSLSAQHAATCASTVITVSEAIRSEILDEYVVSPEKVLVAYPGIDRFYQQPPTTQAQDDVLAKFGIQGDYVLSVNHTNLRKNTRNLLRAFASLLESRHQPLSLVLVGGWNLRECNPWRLAAECGVDAHVHVTGYVTGHELRCLYHHAGIFCMPSLYEGFGMPVAEAMACGVPVVVSEGGALEEVAGGCGILVDPADSRLIANGMALALNDIDWRQAATEKGKVRAKQFTWQTAAKTVVGALQNALCHSCSVAV